MWGYVFTLKLRKSHFDMNLTVVIKGTQNNYSLATFLTRFVKWWQKSINENYIQFFCFSCKISKSEVTIIWHDSVDIFDFEYLKKRQSACSDILSFYMYTFLINATVIGKLHFIKDCWGYRWCTFNVLRNVQLKYNATLCALTELNVQPPETGKNILVDL